MLFTSSRYQKRKKHQKIIKNHKNAYVYFKEDFNKPHSFYCKEIIKIYDEYLMCLSTMHNLKSSIFIYVCVIKKTTNIFLYQSMGEFYAAFY